jgi:hypothetical protein
VTVNVKLESSTSVTWISERLQHGRAILRNRDRRVMDRRRRVGHGDDRLDRIVDGDGDRNRGRAGAVVQRDDELLAEILAVSQRSEIGFGFVEGPDDVAVRIE